MTTFHIADDVAWVSRHDLDDGTIPMAYAAVLPTGRPVVLEGSACVVWLAVADGGTLDDIIGASALMAETDPDSIRDDVRALVDSLVAGGLVRAD